ncbi:MAG: ABC transporter permease, partial [Thermotogaceae bacterium]|nr:ABC transporter permease [Thermotogaceae bacterium]
MISFIIRRILIMIPMMIVISMICFFIIELQPGDYVSTLLENPR